MNVFKRFWNWFKGLLKETQDFLRPLALEIARNGGKLVLETAMEAVAVAESHGGTGEEKFKRAREYAIDRLESQGQQVVINALHGAIEAAVARMKQGE
jgi:hypothetical protein